MPPLRYDDVYRLKREFPDLAFELNGGIRSLEAAEEHLERLDGVMIGRAAWDDPYLFAAADGRIFGEPGEAPSRRQVVESMTPYLERRHRQGLPIARVTRHLLNLFAGQPGARRWRRTLSENAHLPGVGPELVAAAMAGIPDEVLDERPYTSTSTSSPLTRTL